MKEQDRKHSVGTGGGWGWGIWTTWGGALAWVVLNGASVPSVATGHLCLPPRLSLAILHIDLLTFKAYSSHWQEVSGPVMVDGKLGHLWMTWECRKSRTLNAYVLALAGYSCQELWPYHCHYCSVQAAMCEREKWILNHESFSRLTLGCQ